MGFDGGTEGETEVSKAFFLEMPDLDLVCMGWRLAKSETLGGAGGTTGQGGSVVGKDTAEGAGEVSDKGETEDCLKEWEAIDGEV